MIFNAILTFVTWGLWAIVWAILYAARPKNPPGTKYYKCDLCGYAWYWGPGHPLPSVNIRPDLIAKGEQRLREEEERRRRD